MRPGPVTRNQMLRLGKMWQQGEHVLVSGATGSGKTVIANAVLNERDRRGAHIVVFCFKTKRDDTIEDMYLKHGYARYKEWPRRDFPSWERKVVIWPDVSSAKGHTGDIIDIQRNAFAKAFGKLLDQGNRTVLFDDGLYICNPQFLGMSQPLAMAHAMGRSDKLTCVTNVQRPSHLPLILYSSADHAIVGATREANDLKRLGELQASESSRELQARLVKQQKHDFLWVPARNGGSVEPLNFKA